MSRNLGKQFGYGQVDTDRLEGLMNAYIEYALIEVEPEDLATEDVEMDAKDRHVLAAAISVDADILLTQNIPRMWMTERGIELLNAGELLTRPAEHFPEKIRAAHQQAVRTSREPEAEILSTLVESIVGESVTDTVRALATDDA